MLKNIKTNILESILAVIFIIAITFIVFIPRQQDFYQILIPISLAFVIYFFLLFYKQEHWKFWILVAFITKFILLFAFPNLSDDIYRFAWDGRLIREGWSPYSYLPGELLDFNIKGITKELYEQLNSPSYYSVYPPVNQFFFWFVSLFSSDSIIGDAFGTKLIILIADVFSLLGILKLLTYYNLPKSRSLIYVLNPLLLVELNGNLHFEGVMISFFIWFLVFLHQSKYVLSAILLSLSIGTKLVPIFFVPIILKYIWDKPKRNGFIMTLFLMGVLMAIPLIWGLNWQNFGKSIDLYFQKFEFNASVYYIFRWVGKLISGYNLIHYIGPFLGLISLSSVLYIAFRKKISTIQDIAFYSMIALSIYYLNTTTVHPWYMSFLVMLTIFSQTRYALVWSFMIVLSYTHYLHGGYVEHYWFIGLEYLVVFYFIWLDYRRLNHVKKPSISK